MAEMTRLMSVVAGATIVVIGFACISAVLYGFAIHVPRPRLEWWALGCGLGAIMCLAAVMRLLWLR